MSKCEQCGEEMTLIDMPQAIFTIPFTKGRYCIWDWYKKGLWCSFCAEEKQRNEEQCMYDAIADSVSRIEYEQGFFDGINQ